MRELSRSANPQSAPQNGRRRARFLHRLHAKTHSRPVKSLIGSSRRTCYLEIVQTDTPLPTGSPETQGVCVMTFSTIQKLVRRIAPAALTTAMFGLVVAFATVGVVGVSA